MVVKTMRVCFLGAVIACLSACSSLGGLHSTESSNSPAPHSLDSLLSIYCPSLKVSNRIILTKTVEQAAAEHGIEPGLVFAVITAESNCRQRARSRAGALGLMQLMPRTARWLGVRDPFSKQQNVAGGAKYLAHLLELFDSDVPMALAAYNAGPTRVRRHGGIPPFSETRNYVKKVIAYYEQYRIARW